MIVPIILAGGKGTRLWPASNDSAPKQFAKIGDINSAIQNAIALVADKAVFYPPIFVINKSHKDLLLKEVASLNDYQIILEPEGKGTAAAIYSAMHLLKDDDLFMVVTSDLYFENNLEFLKLLSSISEEQIKKNGITLFGMQPFYPETGYGYLSLSDNGEVLEFKEKPSVEVAKHYMQNGYLWNSGLALCSVRAVRLLALQYDFTTWNHTINAMHNGAQKENIFHLNISDFQNIIANSFDYAILEKAPKLFAIKSKVKWQDLGSWSSIYDFHEKDFNGNVLSENVTAIDTINSQIICQNSKKKILALSMQDITVIETEDAILIMPTNKSQELGHAVKSLKNAPVQGELF